MEITPKNNYFKDIQCQIYTLNDARDENILLIFVGETPIIFNIQRAAEYIRKILIKKGKKSYHNAMGYDLKDEYHNDIKQIKIDIVDYSLAINNINYQPLSKQLFEDQGKIYYNIYRKSLLLCEAHAQIELKNKKSNIKDFKDIYDLIFNLCGRNKEQLNWFMEWLAHLIQKPLEKLPTAVIFQGEQGTGKTKFQELVISPLFGDSFKLTSQMQIVTGRNTYVYGSQLVWVDEVSNNSGKFNMADILKKTVTDKRVPVQELYKSQIVTVNYAGYIISTNHMVSIPLEEDDRRWSVFKSKKLERSQGWKLIESLEKNQDKQLLAFAIYLLRLEYKPFNVSIPCITPARQSLIVNSMNNLSYFLTVIEEELREIIDESRFEETFFSTDEKNNKIYFYSDKFYKFYMEWCRINEIRSMYDRKKFIAILCDRKYKYGSYKIEKNNITKTTRCLVTDLQPFKEGLVSHVEYE